MSSTRKSNSSEFVLNRKKTASRRFFFVWGFRVSVYLTAGVTAAAAGVASFLAALCATLCFFTFSAAGLAMTGVAAAAVVVAGTVAAAGVAVGDAAKEAAAKTVVIKRAAKFFTEYLSVVEEENLQSLGVILQRLPDTSC
jgi:hypothetical protein